MIFSRTRFLFFFSISYCILLGVGVHSITAQKSEIDTAQEFFEKGRSYYRKENYKESVAYYKNAEEIFKKLGEEKSLCLTSTLKGHAYMMNDQNQKALDAYYTSLAIAQKIGDLDQEAIANSGLVLVYKKTNQFDKALKVSRKTLQSIDQTSFKDTKIHVDIITTNVEVYLDTERYDSVVYYADQGIAMSKILNHKEGLIDLYIKKGVVFYYQEDYEQSLDYLYKAEKILQNNNINNRFYPTVNSNYFVASCYYQQQLYDKAINRLLLTIKASDKNDLLKLPVRQSHLLLANCYAAKKDFEQSTYWHAKYSSLNEAYQKRKDQTVNKIYEKEAQQLEDGIKVLQSQRNKDKTRTTYAYGIAGLLLGCLVILVVLYKRKQRSNQRIFNELLQQITALETKEKEVVTVKETTKEIAKEVVIDEDTVNEILKGLDRLERQEFFLRSDCNLRTIAKKVKTNATYLSKIINLHKKKNFNDYLNELRIDYALKRLKNDKKFRAFSIKSIATEIGYKSDYSFAKHFKTRTGLNPSYYIKKIAKQEHTRDQLV
ncbi:helix-turn-helix domain-containing protein [Aquimarina sp. AD10]|uniref:helix-turn-helix domain-containing protein n=1 Tax=Aquimarina sp. AD10 TaxID=1714849 RepID=UPI000E549CBA|nr:helix-turn-helix domain-containing protein [Aquimarina sp. AD10]AXT61570.1 helix-turn-helix domain-containing protein [Aquimarina sp. AD10]RKM90054.1 helix-turn-helix domain-containing protein [Aquimarina sp. AD10]